MAGCRDIYDIHTMPDVDSINKYGAFNFSHSRLAFIDGAQDPWRAATPHAIGLKDRESTTSEPFILIDPGVHHWDEYGVEEGKHDDQPNFPPLHILDVQAQEVTFVKAWVKEYHEQKQNSQAKAQVQSLRTEEL